MSIRHGLAVLLCAAAAPATAQVYARLDAQGQLQVSRDPVAGVSAFDPHRPWQARPRQAVTANGVQVRSVAAQPPSRWQAALRLAADTHGVEPSLLHAVIQVESGYNPKARSRAGAIGLMQVIPSTGRRFGATDLYDPAQNLQAGARYLAWLQRRFSGDLSLVLAAYNAGEGAVDRHGGRVPPYAETRAYVQKVIAIYHAARQASQ